MIAIDIIPVRRLPGHRDTFTYLWPLEKPPIIGAVVRIPFARSHVDGIVWRIHQTVPVTSYPLKPIEGVERDQAVITPWQCRVFQSYADRYRISLGSMLAQFMPDRWPVELPVPRDRSERTDTEKTSVHWYRSRQEIESWIDDQRTKNCSVCIIEPTVEEVHAVASRLQIAHTYDGQTSPAVYRRLYRDIISGEVTTVVGTPLGLFLPWPTRPLIILDQEEHASYKRTERFPYEHVGRWLDAADIPHHKTTPTPSIRTMVNHHPSPPTRNIERHLGTLGGPGTEPWRSFEVDDALRTHPDATRIWILPRRGYASILLCRSCGHEVVCHTCGRRIRIIRHDARHSRCSSCQTLQPLPTACPVCRAVSWKYVGIGVEQWRKRFPVDEHKEHLLTINDTATVRAINGPKIVTIVSADTLLAWPDFTATERAMSMIGRLESVLHESDMLYLQTFEPNLRLWQHWLNGSAAWIAEEIEQRRTYGLPPIIEHWAISIPHTAPKESERTIETRLRQQGLQITELTLSGRSRGLRRRLVLRMANGKPLQRQTIDPIIPPSWRVDIDVDAWVP